MISQVCHPTLFVAGLNVLLDALITRGTISELKLNNNQITDAGAAALAEAVAKLPSLTVLDVQDNQFGDQGAKEFAKMLKVID
jgi:Ran GTPase-activating protein (RanGAP) involved in mRNA processing and transport